jgi:hypothetical protein
MSLLLGNLDDSESRGAARFANMMQRDASIIVDGKIDGADFSFVSSLDAEQEREASFDVGEGAANITLNVDITRWFTGASGQLLDSRVSSDHSAIEANIKASIDAFDDDDHDGAEDHDDDHD